MKMRIMLKISGGSQKAEEELRNDSNAFYRIIALVQRFYH
jgi:hypothetical protein